MLNLADNLSLPVDLVTETIAILAKRGSGKSYTASVMAEEMLGAGAHVVAIDPTGIWWGLRMGADGTPGGGLPILILGGNRGDLPLEPNAGHAIAELVVKESLSCVLDMSLFTMPEMSTFLAAFLTDLYRLKAGNLSPLHLIVDEADAVAPQTSGSSGQSATLAALDTIVRRGRVRGLGTTLITQRPAVLSKNVLTQIEVLIAQRLTAPLDKRAIDDWVKSHGTEEERKQIAGSLATLGIGEAWIWAPNLTGELRRVQIRRRTTFDSSSTPKVGEHRTVPMSLSEMDISALRDRLTTALQAALEKDPEVLRQQIAELKRQLSERPVETRTVEVERIVEIPVFTEVDRARVREWMETAATTAKQLMQWRNDMEKLLNRTNPSNADQNKIVPLPMKAVPTPVPSSRKQATSLTRPTTDQTLLISGRASSEATTTAYPDGAMRLLSALSFGSRLTRAQLGVRAKLTMSGGAATTYVNRLKTDGLITASGGFFIITDKGLAALGKRRPDAPQTTEEILAMWRPGLSNRAYDMLLLLLEATKAGKGLSSKQLADALGISAAGGAFGTYRTELTQNDLAIKKDGLLYAAPALFPVSVPGTGRVAGNGDRSKEKKEKYI